MNVRPLWEVAVETSAEAEDAVTSLLEGLLGVPAVSYTDLESGTVTAMAFVEVQSPRGKARRSTSKGSAFPLGGLAASSVRHLTSEIILHLDRLRAAGLDVGPGRVSIRRLAPENWAESWKRHFKPIEVSPALLLKPTWSRRRPRSGQAVVVLDPGLSFGTGHHATTRFCLEQISAFRRRGQNQSFLDVGCGSGILAIAAAKLGYDPAEGFDFDEEAVRVAQANARRNRARPRLYRADLTQLPLRASSGFDLICANLTADLLVSERDRIIRRLRPGGRLVLAGILTPQFRLVQAAYEAAGLRLATARTRGQWRSGAFEFVPDRDKPRPKS